MPRMQRPRRLLVTLDAKEALDCLTNPAVHHDYSSLTELQFNFFKPYGSEASMEQGARALEGMLHQASALVMTSSTRLFVGASKTLHVTRCPVPCLRNRAMRLREEPAVGADDRSNIQLLPMGSAAAGD